MELMRHVVAVLRDQIAIAADPVRHARRLGVRVGSDCRLIGVSRDTFGSEPYLIGLGDHVTITAGVRFITHDGGVWTLRDRYPEIDVVDRITIGSNVFVGTGVTLLPGSRIGDDVVIGAGAVVTGAIPAGCVAVGVPARPTRSIAEYHERVLARAIHVRNRPQAEKRALFEAFLAGEVDGQGRPIR
jgi:acetyltransferase-like isoleucine patch superfamily enzyme